MELRPVSAYRTATIAAADSNSNQLVVVNPSNDKNYHEDEILEAEVIETNSSRQKDKPKAFIEANTEQVTLSHLKNECIIPVFRDNEKTISHFEFIDSVNFVVQQCFKNETILDQT